MEPLRDWGATARQPSWPWLLVSLGLVACMAWLRLVVFPTQFVPLAYSLPLFVTLLCRDRRILWLMVACFLALTGIKVRMLVQSAEPPPNVHAFAWMQVLTILVMATSLHLVIKLMARQERSNALLAQTNAELEARNEELAAREEEIHQQNEELAQQMEELGTQAGELQALNEQLAMRERTLAELLETSASDAAESESLARLGVLVERLLGPRVGAAALVEPRGQHALLLPLLGGQPAAVQVERGATLASLAVARDRAVCIPDLARRPDLHALELPGGLRARTALAAPMHTSDTRGAALEVHGSEPGEWSEDELRLVQWLAEHCGRLVSNLRLREGLAHHRHLLRTVTDNASSALVISSPSGECLYLNPAAEQLCGVRAEQAVGRDLHALFHGRGHADPHAAADCPLHVMPRMAQRAIADSVVRAGERVPVLRSAIPVEREDKQAAVLLELRDVGEQRRAEREREQLLESERAARGEAERASRAKDEFVATLSHELRTPLNAILGWSALLARNSGQDGELSRGLQVIERNARHQAQLISDLLDISRINAGKLRLDFQPVDMQQVVDGALTSIQPAAQSRELRIERILECPGRLITGDAERLQQVVWNLLTNAIKFTPRGGWVRVELLRAGASLHLRISDNGQGMDPATIPHLFERYQQGDGSPTRRHGGLGLGLAIVKHLVDLHGGSIEARSDGRGMGSSFSLYLPIQVREDVPAGVERAPRNGTQGAGPSLHGVRVLVVDDEQDARDLIQRLLREHGAEVVTAASAEDALAALASMRPQILVSDIGMPETDGYDLIRRIRSGRDPLARDVPAIALTAFARSEDRTRALLAGFQSHVPKPVEPAELIATVASLASALGRSSPGDGAPRHVRV